MKDKELKLEDEDWYESAEDEDWYERRDTECAAVSRSVVTREKENTIKTETADYWQSAATLLSATPATLLSAHQCQH